VKGLGSVATVPTYVHGFTSVLALLYDTTPPSDDDEEVRPADSPSADDAT
jgi:hypothetical protein